MKYENAKDLINSIDFEELKAQKSVLIERIDDMISSPDAAVRGQVSKLQGILALIDEIQDFAVDVLGRDENEVFDFSEE